MFLAFPPRRRNGESRLEAVGLAFVCVVAVVLLFLGFGWLDRRDKTSSRDEGYKAALQGIPATACPYTGHSVKQPQWMWGWQAGFKELKEKSQ